MDGWARPVRRAYGGVQRAVGGVVGEPRVPELFVQREAVHEDQRVPGRVAIRDLDQEGRFVDVSGALVLAAPPMAFVLEGAKPGHRGGR